jgi:hypothetical protein
VGWCTSESAAIHARNGNARLIQVIRFLKDAREIFERIEEIFADREGVPCWRAAELLAEHRIEAINRARLLNTGGQLHPR